MKIKAKTTAQVMKLVTVGTEIALKTSRGGEYRANVIHESPDAVMVATEQGTLFKLTQRGFTVVHTGGDYMPAAGHTMYADGHEWSDAGLKIETGSAALVDPKVGEVYDGRKVEFIGADGVVVYTTSGNTYMLSPNCPNECCYGDILTKSSVTMPESFSFVWVE